MNEKDETHHSRAVTIPPVGLEGILGLPASRPVGLILFAHGSGSSRLSPRNEFVARALREAGFATLLFDLLTEREAMDRSNVFDIGLLSDRLCAATEWSRSDAMVHWLAVGYFGASTGAAATLVAAARPGHRVSAIVARGGRPDLAGNALPHVKAPTLLIVGGVDTDVLALNRSALEKLRCEAKLEIVPRATHLFEEEGALERVVGLARRWFLQHLAPAAT